MGHALNLTFHRILWYSINAFCGYQVLWIPGTDHAGIATQNVVEKALKKEVSLDMIFQEMRSLTRFGSGNMIMVHALHQIRSMGASVDWSHERFTMDEDANMLYKAFC